jgi:ATP-dependent exoDNAse (exonuclease V) beta subunit
LVTACRLEYAVAGVSVGGALVAGYVDLVVERDEGVIVIDFKTDEPPEVGEELPRKYLAQVAGYASVLAAGLGRPAGVRAAMLYTADGSLRWVEAGL